MTTFVVTSKSDGREVYRYSGDTPMEWSGFEFATHDHTPLAEDPAKPTQAIARVWDQIDFMRRLTQTERITIRTLAKSNVEVEDYMARLTATPRVRNDDPDVVGGLTMLEAAGVLAPGRAAEILHGS